MSLNHIRPATLNHLHNVGFKLLPLSIDNEVVIPWTPIYENPDYWSAEKLVAEYWKFKNVATVFGKTHLKDSEGRDQYLLGLDCDSEPVYKILTTHIDAISDSRLKSKLQELCSKFEVDTTKGKVSLFDCLKGVTVVVKTKKPYGFQTFWLSHTQHDHIGTKNCKSGHEFEIKTDKSLGHATLPPSTHRNDKNFRYSYTGRTDKIETIDELYDILIGLLKECLTSDSINGNHTDKSENDDSRCKDQSTTTFYDLSMEMIQTTVAYLTPYYIVKYRHNFALNFSGATSYAKISEGSASKILSQIAANTNDDEIQSRLNTLHATYEKAAKGELITGGPTLADLISGIKGCELEEARRIVTRIQSFWYDDIQLQRKANNDVIQQLKKVAEEDQDESSRDNYYTTLKAELDSEIPDGDYVESVIRTIKRSVKQEDSLVRQIVYTVISKDSADPINLAVLAPTSEGKTYPVLESLQYFPKQDISKIGSMTPKVIIRQNGILVDSNNQPIADRIKELKRNIKETDKNSEERENLEQQLRQLLDEAKVLIDLRGKLWVFLEPPYHEIWAILKPILSHDDFEIEHPYVYEVQGMGFKVKKVVTRGWPACIFCSAKNESNWPAWPEIQSRFLITSPNMVQEKYLDGNMLIAQKMGLPSLLQQSIIVSDSQVELAKKCVTYILHQIRQHIEKNNKPVWIPYAPILAQFLPAEKGPDNRITKRILSFLIIITLARAHLRGRLEYGNESLAIANIDEDLHEVLHITQNLSGIPPYKLKVFKEIFLPLYKSKQSPDKSNDDNKQERITVLTTRELCEAYNEKTGKTITTNNLKQNYLNEFTTNGLIDEEDSILDKRQKIYYPLIDLPVTNQESCQKIKKLSISDRLDNILQHPSILMPKNCINLPDNWLELEIFDLIKYPPKLDKFELYNEQNERICICRFMMYYEKRYRLNGYFSKPILCNYYSKIFGGMTYSSTIKKEECKKLSNEGQMDNLVISDMPKTGESSSGIVAKEGKLPLRHSPAAHVLTNSDLEDEECDIDINANGNSGGESI